MIVSFYNAVIVTILCDRKVGFLGAKECYIGTWEFVVPRGTIWDEWTITTKRVFCLFF